MPVQQKILKISAIGAAGFVVTYALLALVPHFLLLPAITVSGLLTLSAIASYAPPHGIRISRSLPLIVSVFVISLFLVSSAFNAVPQRAVSLLIPLVITFAVFLALMVFGFRTPKNLERKQ